MTENGKGLIERFLSNTSAVATILVAVVGQAVFSIVFQIINNEQQEAKITYNSNQLKEFKDQVYNMQTPLSQHVIKIEGAHIDMLKGLDNLSKRLDTMDNAGTRALSLVASNEQRMMSQVDRLGERILIQDRKLVELEAKISNPVLQAKLEELNRNETRLEDQQRRIIEALDNLYSQVSKIPPVLRNDNGGDKKKGP